MIEFVIISALAIWLVPAIALGSGLTLIAIRAETVNPADWRRCAGDDPNDPATKTCWVHATAGPYCPRHDGSGRQVIYS